MDMAGCQRREREPGIDWYCQSEEGDGWYCQREEGDGNRGALATLEFRLLNYSLSREARRWRLEIVKET